MRNRFLCTLLVLSVAFVPCVGRTASAPSAASSAFTTLSTWNCQTTQADGSVMNEVDTIVPMGRWAHGTARPPAGARSSEPFYDYYIGYANGHWTYIQVNARRGTYFVGTSSGGTHAALNGSRWNVIYPENGGTYAFSETANQFSITYTNLKQVCKKTGTPAALQAAPTLRCTAWQAGAATPTTSYLSITPLGPHWWQGVGTDAPSGGNVIYTYDIFNAGLQRIAVAINTRSGTYAIATSYLAPTLENTVWTVVYPTLEHGFSFRNVAPDNALPTQFTLVFTDGHQDCTTL